MDAWAQAIMTFAEWMEQQPDGIAACDAFTFGRKVWEAATVKHSLTVQEDKDLQTKAADQGAEIERLTKEVDFRQSLLRESNRNCADHAGIVWTRNVTIAQQSDRIAELEKEVERLKTVPMKYRRMAFNAQLQDENALLRTKVAELTAKEFDWAKANAKCTDIIKEQAERIAKHAKS